MANSVLVSVQEGLPEPSWFAHVEKFVLLAMEQKQLSDELKESLPGRDSFLFFKVYQSSSFPLRFQKCHPA